LNILPSPLSNCVVICAAHLIETNFKLALGDQFADIANKTTINGEAVPGAAIALEMPYPLEDQAQSFRYVFVGVTHFDPHEKGEHTTATR